MNTVHTSRQARRQGALGRRGAPPAGQRLTREAVVERAAALIERDGYPGFSMRALAGQLGVRPNALYNHVRSRDDLLDAVAEQFVATIELPGAHEPWPDWVTRVAIRLHTQLVWHPELADVLLSRAGSTTAGPALLRQFIDHLVAAGVDRAVAHVAWHTMLTVVVGSAQQHRAGGADQGPTFDAVLEIIQAGLATTAGHSPSARAAALATAHALAND